MIGRTSTARKRGRLTLELSSTGQEIAGWSSYTATSDLLTPADEIVASIGVVGTARERRELLATVDQADSLPGMRAFVSVDESGDPSSRRAIQFTGVLRSRRMHSGRSGTQLTVRAHDRATHLVGSSVDLRAIRNTPSRFVEMVEALVEPWQIPVIVDATAARDLATGIAVSIPEGSTRTSRAALSSGELASRFRPGRATVISDDEEALDAERAASRAARRAEAAQRSAGLAAGLATSPGGGGTAPEETIELSRLRDRSLAARASAARAASRSVSASGQSAVGIRALSVREARPQPGETRWAFILRHAIRFGLLPWMSPDGALIIAAPSYGSRPTHRLVRRIVNDPNDPNTIIEGGEDFNVGARFSEVVVYGRGLGRDAMRAPIVGRATDVSMPYEQPLVIHDASVRTAEEAERRAVREMMRARHERRVCEYVVSGHGSGGVLYAVDTIVEVYDEVAQVSGQWYVTARTFVCDRANGTATTLRLVQKGSILL